jgi:hypothetical protein
MGNSHKNLLVWNQLLNWNFKMVVITVQSLTLAPKMEKDFRNLLIIHNLLLNLLNLNYISLVNPATFLCLSQVRDWISIGICCGSHLPPLISDKQQQKTNNQNIFLMKIH